MVVKGGFFIGVCVGKIVLIVGLLGKFMLLWGWVENCFMVFVELLVFGSVCWVEIFSGDMDWLVMLLFWFCWVFFFNCCNCFMFCVFVVFI